MKKYIKSLLWIAAAAFAVVSCQEKVQPHEPGEPDASGCYGVYFPTQDASGMHVYSPVQDPSVEIKLKRSNTSGSITVPVKCSFSEDGIFNVADATFADGQEETTFTVRFDSAKEGNTYSASFTIEDTQYASMYKANAISLDFSVMRVQMSTLKDESGKNATVTFHVLPDFLADFGKEEAYDVEGIIQYYEVEGVRYGQIVPNEGGIWGSDAVINFKWYPKASYVINEVSYQPVEVEAQYTGYELDGSEVGEDHPCAIIFSDYYHHFKDVKSDPGLVNTSYLDFVKNYGANYKLSYYDGHGGFYFNLVYDIEGTSFWYSLCENTVVGIASGYSRVDYTLKLESDYSYDGVSPVSITAGIDVASIKYAAYEGELTATQIANKIDAIVAGTDETVEFSEFEVDEEAAVKYATLELAPETTGMYTFVAVAYDKDAKPHTSGSVTFKHIAADDVADHAVEIDVFTEDTPERYKNYHAYDSFAYCISGEDLTDVHMGIFKYDDVAKDPDAVFDAVKKDAAGKFAVSADILKQINGEGGYYSVATSMPAKTQLCIVVWGTNGDMDDFVYDVYKTAPLPYVWDELGTGVYTEDVAGGIYGIGPIDVNCDVFEEATTPGLYKISGFQKNYIDLLMQEGMFGEGMIGADVAQFEGMLWRDAELIIDATNPDNVLIELQDYGICLNTNEGFIDGLTSVYNGKPFSVGTLKDGVIAFPTPKGMLATIAGDGYYYANQDGAFKVVLPEKKAEPKAVVGKRSIKSQIGKSFFKQRDREVFERDPKPVKVAAKVNYTRKENGNTARTAKISKCKDMR